MPSPGWLRRVDLPLDAGGRRYIDPDNLDQILDQFANWRGNVNGGAHILSNAVLSSATARNELTVAVNAHETAKLALYAPRSFEVGDTAACVLSARGGTLGTHDYAAVLMRSHPGTSHGGAALMTLYCGGQSTSLSAPCAFAEIINSGAVVSRVSLRANNLEMLFLDSIGVHIPNDLYVAQMYAGWTRFQAVAPGPGTYPFLIGTDPAASNRYLMMYAEGFGRLTLWDAQAQTMYWKVPLFLDTAVLQPQFVGMQLAESINQLTIFVRYSDNRLKRVNLALTD